MPTVLFRSIIFLLLMSSVFALANAQDERNPTGKILEIHSGRQPRPSVIPLYREHNYGFWASGFPRLKDWKMPSGGDPVQAMDFRARLVGDKAEMTISLFSGKRFGENVEIIARVSISDGQTIEVTDLKKFGYEPITVKMLATSMAVADVPLVTNPAPQLRTTVSNIVATLPTFSVNFLNDSPKEILAFSWHTETDGRRLMSGLSQGRYGNALIDSGGTYEIKIKSNKRETDLNPVIMIIGAVIYRDGSIDGDPKAATSFLAFTEGRKKALEQIVPLLQKAAEKGPGRADIVSLIAKIDGLTDGGPRNNGRPSTPLGIAFAGIVTETVGLLREADRDFTGKTDAELGTSLIKLAKFYSDWQTRMK